MGNVGRLSAPSSDPVLAGISVCEVAGFLKEHGQIQRSVSAAAWRHSKNSVLVRSGQLFLRDYSL